MSLIDVYFEWIKENEITEEDMKAKKLDQDIVIIAYDIDEENNSEGRGKLREFITEELGGTMRTQSVYEFDFSKCGMKWSEISKKIKDTINAETDTVYLWSLEKEDDSNNLYRIKIGK